MLVHNMSDSFYREKPSMTAKDCPTRCECKWKKGKETVECVNASLTSIPEGLNVDTQVSLPMTWVV